MKNLINILRNESGAVAVEFALLSTGLLVAIMPVLDFGYYFLGQHKLDQAVSAASLSLFKNRASANFTGVGTYVSNGVNAPSTVTTTVSCNGTSTCVNTSRACYCLTTTGTYNAAASCTASCTGGSYSTGQKAGYYVKISSSYTHTSLAVPKQWLNGGTVSRAVTVRLQ